jgi:hypothetical protein
MLAAVEHVLQVLCRFTNEDDIVDVEQGLELEIVDIDSQTISHFANDAIDKDRLQNRGKDRPLSKTMVHGIFARDGVLNNNSRGTIPI